VVTEKKGINGGINGTRTPNNQNINHTIVKPSKKLIPLKNHTLFNRSYKPDARNQKTTKPLLFMFIYRTKKAFFYQISLYS
jgi:hypothetical protein